jgi:hypothetical protein
MNVLVRAIRDADGAILGETVFDITDRAARGVALTELLNHIFATAPDPLRLPPFTFRFDVA